MHFRAIFKVKVQNWELFLVAKISIFGWFLKYLILFGGER